MFILCHAAKNEPRKRAKGFPLGTPVRAQTTLRYHFAHVCAKPSKFSFCEHGFKKAALTEVARTQKSKNFCYLLRAAVRTNFKRKRDSKSPCQQQTHLGRVLMRPRWRTLVKAKTPPFIVRTAGGGEVPEGKSGRAFLVRSLPRGKE